jgi:putative ATP-binding cassette transporter
VALLEGERTERRLLNGRFDQVFDNFYRIVNRRKLLMMFTALYGQISAIIPYVVAAPFYFLGRVQLGTLTQTAGAFARVEGSLSFFIDRYVLLAEYKSVIDRLTTFDEGMARGQALGRESRIRIEAGAGDELAVRGLTLALPDGRAIVRADGLSLRPGEATLVTARRARASPPCSGRSPGSGPSARGRSRRPGAAA